MDSPYAIACNGAQIPKLILRKCDSRILDYRDNGLNDQNIKALFPNFIGDLYFLPKRIKDLLEIAAYVYGADRLVSRGSRDSIEYHAWARSFWFFIKVRDYEFWSKPEVKKALNDALCFMSGDREFRFEFEAGHNTLPFSLFDNKEFALQHSDDIKILLFSGGLDSLAGAISVLEETKSSVCLISHRSNPSTKKTQDGLVEALNIYYPERIKHYKFDCSLTGCRRIEESQRTRAFLYNTIAFSLAEAYKKDSLYVYENGITSINFPRRQDLMNARASRTTHPRTLFLLSNLFSLVSDRQITIKAPFVLLTKTDIISLLKTYKREHLIPSAVSCSKTFKNIGGATHCGCCFQCVDRRLATYAAEQEDAENLGLYCLDFIRENIGSNEEKTALIDYLRQARNYAQWNIDHFSDRMMPELTYLVDYISNDEIDAIEKVYNLCNRHGKQVAKALQRIRAIYDDPFEKCLENSLLSIISNREYSQEPVLRLVKTIADQMEKAIPISFQREKPTGENDLNDKVSSLLEGYREAFEREHPSLPFALAKVIPDHSAKDFALVIETKYLRGSTTPSKATEGMAADLIKYQEDSFILFLVYDPERSIHNDDVFRNDFQKKGRCRVCIIR